MNIKKENGKAAKPKYNMWQCTAYMTALAWREKEKKVIFLLLASVLLGVLNSLISLFISPSIISSVETGETAFQVIKTILFFSAALIAVSALNAYVNSNTSFGRIQVRTSLIKALNKKAATTSYPNLFDDKFKSLLDKSSEVTGSNHEATEAIWSTLTSILTSALGFAIYLALLSTLDIFMLAVIIVTALISYFVDKQLFNYRYRHRSEFAEQWGKMWYTDSCSRDFTSAKDIRLFGLGPWLRELSGGALRAFIALQGKARRVYFWGEILRLVLSFARNGIAYAYLLSTVLKNGMSVSDFLLYFSAVGGLTSWISGILSSFGRLHLQCLDISTVRECLEYPEPFDFDNGRELNPSHDEKYDITLENVSFRYPSSTKYILENVNLTLKHGEKLAIVGLNGAGKTTLVKLMCGFLDPTDGRVLINGTDMREFRRGDCYKLFSAVFQDFSLLAGSIAMNITQDCDNIDLERMYLCADKAGLLERIKELPCGFDTLLNRTVHENAMMLSGGETQRLMLARALYKDAPIILLDEPTAALDPLSEADMYMKYSEMTEGKSSVYISHRLASTRFCDRIILIADSRISEQGSHRELISSGGKYAELFEVQSMYYREEGNTDEK